MRKVLRRGLCFSLLITLALPLASCDSGGSNSEPDWVGSWEVTNTVDGTTPSNPIFWDFNKDQFSFIVEGSDGCAVVNRDVLEQDGDVVTIDLDEGIEKVSLDASDGTLTVTILESDNPNNSSGDEATAISIDGDPREIAGCS